MNVSIAKIIKGKIESLNWADLVSGLVREYVKVDTIDTAQGKAQQRKTFPVSCDLTNNECKGGRYMDLVPNSKKRSILYFEDGGTSLIEVKGNDYRYRSNLLLVGWVNMEMFDTQNNCSISPQLITSILDSLPKNEFNEDGFTRIKMQFVSERPKNSAIFARYTYDEGLTGFLLYPYDFFALQLKTEFTVNAACFDPIEIKERNELCES